MKSSRVLGFKSLDEVIGRTDLLRQVSRGAEHLDDLDLNPILAKVDATEAERRFSAVSTFRNAVPDSLDAQILRDAAPVFARAEKMQLTYTVRNTHRAVGTRLSAEITTQVRDERAGRRACPGPPARLGGAEPGRVPVQGHQPRSVRRGQRLCRQGPVGRQLFRCGRWSARRSPAEDNVIVGNTVLYGATSGKLFAAGRAPASGSPSAIRGPKWSSKAAARAVASI